MRSSTAIGQSRRNRWKKAARASLTIVMMAAIAVVGLTLLGTKVFAALKAPGSAEQGLVSHTAFEGLLNFEAPAAMVARIEAEKADAEKNNPKSNNASLLAKNWKFTQNPILDSFFVLLSENIYQRGLFIASVEAFLDTLPFSPQIQLFFDQLFTAYYDLARNLQIFVNSFLPPSLRPPLLPPASPYL